MGTKNDLRSKRRISPFISNLGIIPLQIRKPLVVAMWSVAAPGMGHFLLNKYLKGISLVLWELFINQITNLNTAIVYSFSGDIEAAKSVLNEKYVLLYIPVYLFAIWDSYRSTIMDNKVTLLSQREVLTFDSSYNINAFGSSYLVRKKPWHAICWSLTVPSLGQLYTNRFMLGIFTLIITIFIVVNSNLIEAIHYIIIGDTLQSKTVLVPQWFLYFPSVYFFAIYDSYTYTIQTNKLYILEQRNYLITNYQPLTFAINKGEYIHAGSDLSDL
ncbi:hypothetical protein [Paenibacillus sp. SN-8-1]|uniref:hypothetical protein n=1 Tax=Paenibacillus sp. SN-8-1 TaxID=3435409 RepID=UPI003D9A8FD9